MPMMPRSGRALGRVLAKFGPLVLLLAALLAAPAAVLADDGDDGPPNRAPRAIVEIGGTSVVLVSDGDQLHAFVDRIEGNEPVEGAGLTVTRQGSRSPVPLVEESPGLFVAPFKRGGAVRDVFTVSLAAAEGGGPQTATLLYDDAPVAASRGGGGSFGRLLAIALVSGALGAMGSVLAMRWWLHRRRAGAPPLVRAA